MIIQKDPAALEESVQQDGAQYQPPPPSYTELSYPHIQQPEPAHPSPGVPSPNQYPPNSHNQSNSSPSAAAPTPLTSQGEAGRLYREELFALCAAGNHEATTTFGICGIICAIVLFPIGLICLCIDTESKCARCGKRL